MAVSALNILITTPMMLSIIRFVANCHNRTLINRLISFDIFSAICWNLLVLTFSLARYSIGPFPVTFCQLEYLIKNVITLKFIFSINFITVIRYIFVFMSKNPTSVQDEFWVWFLNIWSIGLSIICQTTTLIYPGKEPMLVYICIGKMPKSLIDEKVKNNVSFNVLVVLTLIIRTFINARFFVHKMKKKILFFYSDNVVVFRNNFIQNFNQETLFSFTTNAIAIVVIIISGIAPNVVNRTGPALIDLYPNYLWVYMHHHITSCIALLGLNMYHFYKKPVLFKIHKRNVKKAVDVFVIYKP